MKILISQQAPSNTTQYTALEEKFGAKIDFHPFYKIEPLDAKEFRLQKINFQDYTAVVFSSRYAIDAYFKLCEQNRFKVPETMKYFCTTELVAIYLQKHIVYRKRKIFFGNGTPESVVEQIGSKHKDEKFLITTSEGSNFEPIQKAFTSSGLDHSVAALVKSVPQDLSGIKIDSYNLIVLYNPNDVKSLYNSFPDFKQGSIKFGAYGKSIVKAMEEAGLVAEIQAPTPEAPSVAKAIELYLEKQK